MIAKQQPRPNDVPSISKKPTATSQPPVPWKINPVWTIDKLFGKRHWVRKWVIGLCKSDPQFLLHLIQQPPHYVHFLCLVRLALLKKSDEGDGGLEYAELIHTKSKKKILQEFYPEFTNALVKTLAKLGNKPLDQVDYCCLIQLLSDNEERKCLDRTKHIRQFALRIYAILPKEFRFFEIAKCVYDLGDYEKIMYYIHFSNESNIMVTRKEIIDAMDKMENDQSKSSLEKFLSIIEKKFYRIPFPKPPWEGNNRIYPIRSMTELYEARRKFDDRVLEVALSCGRELTDCYDDTGIYFGGECYYVCTQTPALIYLRRYSGNISSWYDYSLFWEIGYIDIPHISYTKISHRIKWEITKIFLDAGVWVMPDTSLMEKAQKYAEKRDLFRLFR